MWNKRGRKPLVEGPHYKYNLKWESKSKINGDGSGGVIISFSKIDLPQQLPVTLIKLFAR